MLRPNYKWYLKFIKNKPSLKIFPFFLEKWRLKNLSECKIVLNDFIYLFVEGFVVLLIFGKFLEKLKAFLDEILSDDLENLGLLKSLTRDVQRKIFRIDNTLDEVEEFENELVAVVHDKNSSNVEFDRVFLFFVLEEIKGSALGDEKESAELKLTFNREVLDGQVVFPVVGERLVELGIFVILNIIGITGPDGFGLK